MCAFTSMAPSTSPIFRFYSKQRGGHYYTISEAVRDRVINEIPDFAYEGIAFYAYQSPVTGSSPVYRFYNTQTMLHYYTISEAQKNRVIRDLPHYAYEGITFHAIAAQ